MPKSAVHAGGGLPVVVPIGLIFQTWPPGNTGPALESQASKVYQGARAWQREAREASPIDRPKAGPH